MLFKHKNITQLILQDYKIFLIKLLIALIHLQLNHGKIRLL